ncbi:DinB family protein [Brevibacillus fluminis]|uniref:DinB family protein n=1 Tax=Brevibacillus fluminis TaxID=511487 RepID=A0A3M8D2S0_9BACL|nr:DinB family protein [Brevibacillus fluminis]RNB82380.1 DinB family protein [Brevibacillus fluminis]
MSQAIIHTGKSVRQIAIHQLGALDEALFDIQPKGCNNTIRWNVGHIVVALDYFFSLAFPFNTELPETYSVLFHTGTKPADWTQAPPSKEELLHYLTKQLRALDEVSPAQLDETLNNPIEMGPLTFRTAGEVVNFAFAHEAMHLGTIATLAKAAQ